MKVKIQRMSVRIPEGGEPVEVEFPIDEDYGWLPAHIEFRNEQRVDFLFIEEIEENDEESVEDDTPPEIEGQLSLDFTDESGSASSNIGEIVLDTPTEWPSEEAEEGEDEAPDGLAGIEVILEAQMADAMDALVGE